MVIKEAPVTNAVNLAFFMVNPSHRLLADFRKSQPEAGVLDLKTCFRVNCFPNRPLRIFLLPSFNTLLA